MSTVPVLTDSSAKPTASSASSKSPLILTSPLSQEVDDSEDGDSDADEDAQLTELKAKIFIDTLQECADISTYIYIYKEYHDERGTFLFPRDTRMSKIAFALHTWMLKFAGVIPSKHSQQPSQGQLDQSVQDPWESFRLRYGRSKTETLLDDNWKALLADNVNLAKAVLRKANIVVCTTTAVSADIFKGFTFDLSANDETSVTTACETLQMWRGTEWLMLVGDDQQLGPVVTTGPMENPMHRQLEYSTFARFHDLLFPDFPSQRAHAHDGRACSHGKRHPLREQAH